MKQLQWHYDASDRIYFTIAGTMSAQVSLYAHAPTAHLQVYSNVGDAPLVVHVDDFETEQEAQEFAEVYIRAHAVPVNAEWFACMLLTNAVERGWQRIAWGTGDALHMAIPQVGTMIVYRQKDAFSWLAMTSSENRRHQKSGTHTTILGAKQKAVVALVHIYIEQYVTQDADTLFG